MTINHKRQCKEDDCTGPHYARGWCNTHFDRARLPDGTIGETTWSIYTECLGCGVNTHRRLRFCPSCIRAIPMEERRRQYKAWHFKNQQEKRTARKKASADAARHYSLKSMYGLSRADIEAMHEQQDGRCAICRKRPPEGAVGHKRLAVDHNHETGKARGLLCFSCNTALGHLKDRLELVRAAVRYLEEYEECPIAS